MLSISIHFVRWKMPKKIAKAQAKNWEKFNGPMRATNRFSESSAACEWPLQ